MVNFKEIRKVSEAVLETAKDNKYLFAGEPKPESINWGDLKVTEVGVYVDEFGFVEAQVVIEEASPEAHGFKEFIFEKLNEELEVPVRVITEW